MLSLLERTIASADQRLVVLAPPRAPVPDFFRNVPADTAMHDVLVEAVQRLRGRVYLEDGAIRPDHLTEDGLHRTPEDDRAWHLLILNRNRVSACVWYLEHENATSIEELRVRDCPLAEDAEWRRSLRRAVEVELQRARLDRLHYAELGGWAVAADSRHSGEGLLLALAAYSLGRAFGGALGLTTATVRHASSTILRRLGGSSLEADGTAVPPYYDPRYECDMELLRFDSRSPNPKYGAVIELLKERLASVPVVACSESAPAVRTAPAFEWRPVAATGGAAA